MKQPQKTIKEIQISMNPERTILWGNLEHELLVMLPAAHAPRNKRSEICGKEHPGPS